ncbi:MAG: histidinol-phosphate transaminase [Jiangellales bacterium]
MSTALPLRPELVGAVPYGAPQLDVPVRLNTNENPYPPPPEVARDAAAAVADAVTDLNRYPDREASALRTDLAAYLSADTGVTLRTEQLWAANGSNEVMVQILQAFGGPGRTAMAFTPTYSMYPEYARDTFTGWTTGRRGDDFALTAADAAAQVREQHPDVVFLASPNNPTGTALPPDVVAAVYDASDAIVVVDEAYGEFRRGGTPSAVELLDGRPRLVVTRTMSKAFAFAGARLGYATADPTLVDALRVVRLPYHLSALTQAVARVALAHVDALQRDVARLRASRDDLVAWLRAQGFEVPDSDANFVLVGSFADRHAVWAGLLEHGVLVREVGPPQWLRVTVGTDDEMDRFRDALLAVTRGEAGT